MTPPTKQAITHIPYNPSHYNTLPTPQQAHSALRASGHASALGPLLGPIFTKHGVQDLYGLCLLHRPPSLPPLSSTQILLANVPGSERRATLHRYEVSNAAEDGIDLSRVNGCAFRFVVGENGRREVAAYEFEVGGQERQEIGGDEEGVKNHDAFAVELGEALESLGLLDVLGFVELVDESDDEEVEEGNERLPFGAPDCWWMREGEGEGTTRAVGLVSTKTRTSELADCFGGMKMREEEEEEGDGMEF